MKARLQLGAILRRYGIISEAELNLALAHQHEHRVRLGEALLSLGFCTEAHIARALADQLGMPFVDLEQNPPNKEALRLVSRLLAQKLSIVPIEKRDGRLIVVARNPLDFAIDSALRQAVGMPVTIVCGVDSQIQQVLEVYDTLLLGTQATPTVNHLSFVSTKLGMRQEIVEAERFQHSTNSAAQVGALISECFEMGGVEIQLQFKQNTVRVTGTIDGKRKCLAFVSGDEMEIVIPAPPRRRVEDPREVAPFAPFRQAS